MQVASRTTHHTTSLRDMSRAIKLISESCFSFLIPFTVRLLAQDRSCLLASLNRPTRPDTNAVSCEGLPMYPQSIDLMPCCRCAAQMLLSVLSIPRIWELTLCFRARTLLSNIRCLVCPRDKRRIARLVQRYYAFGRTDGGKAEIEVATASFLIHGWLNAVKFEVTSDQDL